MYTMQALAIKQFHPEAHVQTAHLILARPLVLPRPDQVVSRQTGAPELIKRHRLSDNGFGRLQRLPVLAHVTRLGLDDIIHDLHALGVPRGVGAHLFRQPLGVERVAGVGDLRGDVGATAAHALDVLVGVLARREPLIEDEQATRVEVAEHARRPLEGRHVSVGLLQARRALVAQQQVLVAVAENARHLRARARRDGAGTGNGSTLRAVQLISR